MAFAAGFASILPAPDQPPRHQQLNNQTARIMPGKGEAMTKVEDKQGQLRSPPPMIVAELMALRIHGCGRHIAGSAATARYGLDHRGQGYGTIRDRSLDPDQLPAAVNAARRHFFNWRAQP
jgi:hypothetical protein